MKKFRHLYLSKDIYGNYMVIADSAEPMNNIDNILKLMAEINMKVEVVVVEIMPSGNILIHDHGDLSYMTVNFEEILNPFKESVNYAL